MSSALQGTSMTDEPHSEDLRAVQGLEVNSCLSIEEPQESSDRISGEHTTKSVLESGVKTSKSKKRRWSGSSRKPGRSCVSTANFHKPDDFKRQQGLTVCQSSLGVRSAGVSPDSGMCHGYRSGKFCNYCWREGHDRSKCRRRLKLCFRCGKADHLVRSCSCLNKLSARPKTRNSFEEPMMPVVNSQGTQFEAFSQLFSDFSRLMQTILYQACSPVLQS